MEEEKRKITAKEVIAAVLLFAVLAALVAAALTLGNKDESRTESRHRDIFDYFDTASRIGLYYENSERDGEALAIIAAEMKKYHELFDIYYGYEGVVGVYELNKRAKDGAVTVSRELFDFLEFSKEMYTLTGGEVNIAMGAVLSIWHGHRELGVSVPAEDALLAAAEHCDINDLVLDSKNLTVYFADPEMSLDVGAIAKGYTAERIAEALSDARFTSITLNLGGNVRVIGEKPNGEGWTTGVENPHVQGGEYIHKTTLTDGSAVTSGDYQRYYEVDGVRYHHIIDKDTLMPAAHFSSVTVYTRDSGLADALSTALFNMTYDEGAALVNTLDGVKVVWALPDGEVRISQ